MSAIPCDPSAQETQRRRPPGGGAVVHGGVCPEPRVHGAPGDCQGNVHDHDFIGAGGGRGVEE